MMRRSVFAVATIAAMCGPMSMGHVTGDAGSPDPVREPRLPRRGDRRDLAALVSLARKNRRRGR